MNGVFGERWEGGGGCTLIHGGISRDEVKCEMLNEGLIPQESQISDD